MNGVNKTRFLSDSERLSYFICEIRDFDFFRNLSRDAGIAQVVEHRTENPGVPSASLGPGTSRCSSMVEQSFRKAQVGGSIPLIGSR